MLKTPMFTSKLRDQIIEVPTAIRENCSGISIFGTYIQSLLFSTDVAIIGNTNADAIIAVYAFTPHPNITSAVITVAHKPVLCGVGGGITQGARSVDMARDAEFQGALAVVLNAPAPDSTVSAVKKAVDVPVVLTVISEYTNIQEKLEAGVDIINVSGGAKTAMIVAGIRERFPALPIIATGGSTNESVLATVAAGANAITYTPPTNSELLKAKMESYRRKADEQHTL